MPRDEPCGTPSRPSWAPPKCHPDSAASLVARNDVGVEMEPPRAVRGSSTTERSRPCPACRGRAGRARPAREPGRPGGHPGRGDLGRRRRRTRRPACCVPTSPRPGGRCPRPGSSPTRRATSWWSSRARSTPAASSACWPTAAGRSADGHARLARALCQRGLTLWHGPALLDLASHPFARDEGARLDELRLACLETRLDAELRLGRHADALAELERLVAEHPLRERLRALLVLALYRSGRQADALACHADGRRVLVDELGLEPGPELRDLQARILAHDPSLAPPAEEEAPPRLGARAADGHDRPRRRAGRGPPRAARRAAGVSSPWSGPAGSARPGSRSRRPARSGRSSPTGRCSWTPRP